MSSPVLFGVYTARFPYLDSGKDKIRPIIGISQPHGPHNVIIVIPVSSQRKQVLVDATLNDWQKAGLIKPSVARVHRLTTILQSDLTSQLGVLSTADATTIKHAVKNLLGL